ncbi:MAG: HD domain-containing protein [Spirochaetaceae bacterium]
MGADERTIKARSLISFVQGLERLKNETRHAWTSTGRRESIAEHSWRLAMFALVLEPEFPVVDMNRVVRMLLVHDLGEAVEGDVSAKYENATPEEKLRREEDALRELLRELESPARGEIVDLWEEYNRADTDEARMAKALDKLETIIQHNQGANPEEFDYEFNLAYGAALTDAFSLLAAIREELDNATRGRMGALSEGPGA